MLQNKDILRSITLIVENNWKREKSKFIFSRVRQKYENPHKRLKKRICIFLYYLQPRGDAHVLLIFHIFFYSFSEILMCVCIYEKFKFN